MTRALLLLLLLAACQPSTSAERIPPYGTGGLAPWVPWTFSIAPQATRPPEFAGGEVIFRAGRGEASSLSTGARWRLGHQYLLSFELWIDPALARSRASGLAVARWNGVAPAETRLFSLDLDAARGVTFLGRTCVAPSAFGTWQRVYLRVRWEADATGFLELRCGAGPVHAAPLVYAASAIATNRPLTCPAAGDCAPGRGPGAERFAMELGILPGAAPLVPPGGVSLRMRRIVERRLYVVLGREDRF